jgi:hypothetical protein
MIGALSWAVYAQDLTSMDGTPDAHQREPSWSESGRLAWRNVDAAGLGTLGLGKHGTTRSTRVSLPGSLTGGPPDASMASLRWHPQGIVVFVGAHASGPGRPYLAQPDGPTPNELIAVGLFDGTFAELDVDADHIAFIGTAAGESVADLYMYVTHEAKVVQLTDTPWAEAGVALLSDGRTLVYGGNGDLFASTLTYEEREVGSRPKRNVDKVGALPLPVETVYASHAERMFDKSPGDALRPVASGGTVSWFVRNEGAVGLVVSDESGAARVLASNVELPEQAGPALSEDGAWAAAAVPGSSALHLYRVSDGHEVVFDPGLGGVTDVALHGEGGRLYAAFSAFAAGETWRRIFVLDVTVR